MHVTYQRDPQPLTRQGETAFVVLAGLGLVLVWAAMAGLGAAGALFGGGWLWPGSDQIGPAVVGILQGHPGKGFSPVAAARVPGDLAVYSCVGLSEVLTVAALVGAVMLWARYRRPGDSRRGMATRRQASKVLGVRRLRAARSVIRPDLAGADPAGMGVATPQPMPDARPVTGNPPMFEPQESAENGSSSGDLS